MTKLASLLVLSLFLAGAARAAERPGVPDGFTVALGGDMIGPYHPLPDERDTGFARIADLFRKADLGFANQEGSMLDLAGFAGYPAAETGGGYPRQSSSMAGALRGMGLTIVSKANNHATDYGTEGLVATLDALRKAGLAEAGAGLSAAEARAPGYVRTPRGLAALVDVASTFAPMEEAGPAVMSQGQETKPRPGISVLHVREVRFVRPEEVGHLRDLVQDRNSPVNEARIGDIIFRASDRDGWTWEMNPADEGAILSAIREARSRARFVLFSIHAHETAGHDDGTTPPGAWEPMVVHRANEAPDPLNPAPAAFEPVLFHAAIDAGADAVARTGPHVLDGVEIYKGRPIFHGLGGLFFDRNGRRGHEVAGGVVPFPQEQFESVVPVTTYRNGRADVIRLYPVVMADDGIATGGIPHPASPERGRRILSRMQAMSAQFGTRMAIEDGMGVIRIP
ncbi:CapA family protein [Gluconacetobacter sp. Hr-1-5]|uniref:CapA family protein n=1 Tax=Gluconacetobacter sp. Hr-1-5 TaxID=3395370 RepID=UPI003B52B06F